jgi:hypothetical protein
MDAFDAGSLPADLAAELERRFFWRERLADSGDRTREFSRS